MPRHRFSKPWLHQASGYYCTSNHGKRLYLDKDYRVACRKLRHLRAEERRGAQPPQQGEDAPLADLADQFLEDLKQRKKPTSYRSYRYRLLRALRIMGPEVRVGEVRKLHLAKIEQELTATHSSRPWAPTHARLRTG